MSPRRRASPKSTSGRLPAAPRSAPACTCGAARPDALPTPARCDRPPAAGSRRCGRPRTAADAHDAADRRGRRCLRAERRRRRDGHADTHARPDAARRAEDGDGAEGRQHLGRRSQDVKLTTAMSAELTVLIDDAAPFETDATNNAGSTHGRGDRARARPVERARPGARRLRRAVQQPRLRADHAVARRHGLPDFEDEGEGARAAARPHLLQRQLGRELGRPHPEWPENYASFVEVVQLAQEAGATIDISLPEPRESRGSTPGPDDGEVRRRARGPRQEPRPHERPLGRGRERAERRRRSRSPSTTRSCRALDAQLVARGLRDQIQPDGRRPRRERRQPARTHYVWMQWIAANMSDVFDG